MTDKEFLAAQYNALMRRSMQNLQLTDSEMMEFSDIYPAWDELKKYKTGDIVKYGVNSDGETQLYNCIKNHNSTAADTPDKSTTLFKAVGITDDGYPIWTQPLGKKDAYSSGDIVSHEGKLWVSKSSNNVSEPGVSGWTEKKG